MNRGRRPEDWENFKIVRNETSRMVANAKEKYFSNLGQKLSNPINCIKIFWSTMNRLINKKRNVNIPPLLESGLFVTNIEAKANIQMNILYKCALKNQRAALFHLLYQGVNPALRGSPLKRRHSSTHSISG